MSEPRIHGLIMARNEWPLLEVSLTHALVHHADRVHVLDHASTDGTAAGLARLQRHWGDRLTVTHLGEGPYLQEAAMSLLREVVAPADDDWLYAFDADEFGIAGPAAPLRDALAAIEPRHDAVRYEVHNWVAPVDFSATDLDRFADLRFRAVAPLFLPVPAALLLDEIVAGTVNYFDAPFDSKVIVRASAAGWLAAGGHRVVGGDDVSEAILPADAFRAAHFPFLERRRLAGRAAQGRSYHDNGFPVAHGWQSTMVARLTDCEAMDDFWARHSLTTAADRALFDGPLVTRDDALARAFVDTLAGVRDARRRSMPEPDPAVPAPADADVVVPAALWTIRRLQEAAADLRRQLDALEQESWRPQASAPPHLATKIVGRVAAAWAAVVSRRAA